MNYENESASCPSPADPTAKAAGRKPEAPSSAGGDSPVPEAVIAWLDRAVAIVRGEEGDAVCFAAELAWLERRRVIWTSHSWRVALIGITSSGKSTLLNALMGERLLPSRVAPSSNIFILCSKDSNEEPSCQVRYKDGRHAETFRGAAAVREHIRALGDEEHNPQNQAGVEEIQVFSAILPFAEDVVLIDTPGLDAYRLERHEQLTLEFLLPSVDAVVFLQTLKSNAHAELDRFLRIVFQHGKPLVFVHTLADSVVEKLGRGGVVIKTKDQILREHKEIARRHLREAGFTAGTTPIVQVAALRSLEGNAEGSGMQTLVAAVHQHLSNLRPRLIEGRLRQLATELGRMASQHAVKGDLREEQSGVKHTRKQSSGLRRKFAAITARLQHCVEEAITSSAQTLAELEQRAGKLRPGGRDCQDAQTIVADFGTDFHQGSAMFTEALREYNKSIRGVALALNLREEDLTSLEVPSRRAPSIAIPKSVREVDEPGWWPWLKRKFGAGGKHSEENLRADDFKAKFGRAVEDHKDWMKNTAGAAILANTNEKGRVIAGELNRQTDALDAEERSQVSRVKRDRVASALAALRSEIPVSNPVAEAPLQSIEQCLDGSATREIEVTPLTRSLLGLANRISSLRFPSLRDKALALVAKRTGSEAVHRVLIYGFDRDSIERFVDLFWHDFPKAFARMSKDVIELPRSPPFEAVIVCRHPGDDSQPAIADKVSAFLSGPSTIFLMIDVEQIGSALNQIERSRILQQVRPEVGVVLVIQSVMGMVEAQTLAEGVLFLRDELREKFTLQVDAVLANSDEIVLTVGVDALFAKGPLPPTLHDEQEFLATLPRNHPKDMQRATELVRGWRHYRSRNTK